MSLKAFHIVFVAASVALMLGLAGFSFGQYRESGSMLSLLWSGMAVGAAVGLVVYGRYFLRKLKHISFL